MTSFSGKGSPAPGKAKPFAVSVRITCFIDTVSPARSKVRSKMVWARTSGTALVSVGTLKRQLSMPWFQSDITKAMSACPRACG